MGSGIGLVSLQPVTTIVIHFIYIRYEDDDDDDDI